MVNNIYVKLIHKYFVINNCPAPRPKVSGTINYITISTKPLKLDYILTINIKLRIPSTGITLVDKEVLIKREQLENINTKR